jgi:phosphate-selective porin OprO/OprP
MMRTACRLNVLAGALILSLAASFVSAFNAHAQSEESVPAPLAGQFVGEPSPAFESALAVLDLPERVLEKIQYSNSWFTLKAGESVLIDYTGFAQDSASISQVGKQDDRWQARELRLSLRGTIGSAYKVSYLFTASYNGDADPGTRLSLVDASLSFPIGSPATQLTLGKTKETFDYEVVSSFPNLPQQERVLNPFFVTRNVGAKISQVFANHRMTASVGLFNDWWMEGNSIHHNGTDASLRLTGLVWDKPDSHRYFHLGLSGRYVGGDGNTLRYKGRPESNVADNYADTGELPADHAWHLGVEALLNEGPFSLLAEYNRAWVDSPATGNPEFYGYYILASWVITGESRRYDRTTGYARRVMPKGRWGAPELMARLSNVDLDGGPVHGGQFDKTYLGINWWTTRRLKVGFGWGHTWLDRFGKTGVTDSFLTRFQWIY